VSPWEGTVHTKWAEAAEQRRANHDCPCRVRVVGDSISCGAATKWGAGSSACPSNGQIGNELSRITGENAIFLASIPDIPSMYAAGGFPVASVYWPYGFPIWVSFPYS
jgi:hypothetical protein